MYCVYVSCLTNHGRIARRLQAALTCACMCVCVCVCSITRCGRPPTSRHLEEQDPDFHSPRFTRHRSTCHSGKATDRVALD